jgi:hypothetical protein
MKEHALQNAIRNALAGECLLFRVNVGQAWTGSRVDKLPGGRVLIHDARPFTTGVPPGFGDTFGLATRIITGDMIGQKVGVYIAGEVKAGARVTDKQANYLRAVNDNGGAADVWRSVSDALATVARAKGKS